MSTTLIDVERTVEPHEMICGNDRAILRRLAHKVAELASRQIEDEKRRLWYDHNDLKPTRPLVFCDPENGWNEIIPTTELVCRSPLAREWEWRLRREVFWGARMRDDRVIEPYFDISHVFTESGWGLVEQKIGGEHGGAYSWEPALKSYDDIGLLRFPEITVDYAKTRHRLYLAHETFDGLLKVRLKTFWSWSLGMTWTLANLRGLEQLHYDMVDRPDDLHRLMTFLRNGTAARLKFLEENELLTLNNDGSYVGSGGFGWTHALPAEGFDGKVRRSDLWALSESQETVGISPHMFAEFILPYQISLLEGFGLTCYGCCEPLDKRWQYVKEIPHLRRVSVSPWSNREVMAEHLQDRYVYSMKPNPADLAMEYFDPDGIRERMRRDLQVTKGCHVEVIMKDCHTICNDPDRVVEWTRIAREEAEAL